MVDLLFYLYIFMFENKALDNRTEDPAEIICYDEKNNAVIVQDMGVLKFVKEHFPDLPIHASTQMTITDVTGARFLEKQGLIRKTKWLSYGSDAEEITYALSDMERFYRLEGRMPKPHLPKASAS